MTDPCVSAWCLVIIFVVCIIIIMFDGAITCKKLYLYFNVCTAEEVDGESFLLLKQDDLKEMLPLVGPQTKLLKVC